MERFDYIIVGAGAAGCVLAARLSADPKRSVLLLEAGGPDRNPLIHIPAGLALLTGQSVSWGYTTVPQNEMGNRRMLYPQGRTWGGGTSINSMIYTRGVPQDYDIWASAGNVGWSYNDVLPYFRMSENNERLVDDYHAIGGSLNVADQISHNPLTKAFVRSAQEIGLPYNYDVNGVNQEGVTFYQVTQRSARRESSSTAFLRPALSRPNLTVVSHAHVLKILVQKARAVGVEYVQSRQHRGGVKTATADQEVIVSAGAVNSPRLLLLSGIGPADELELVGIRPIHDLPGVGKNLQDHMDVYLAAEVNEPVSYNGQNRPFRALKNILEYMLFHSGPATTCVVEAGAFVRSQAESTSPDLQIHCLPAYVVDHGRMKIRGQGITINTCNLRPKSVGSVALACADPMQPPAIDPNYCGDPEGHDWRMSIEGFRWGRRLLEGPSLKRYVKREYLPGSNCVSDDDIKAYIRKWSKSDYHPVGTCRMGNDALAVVDANLRVRGIDGLRVIDSSIMPRLIGGNTQAPSIMIGEKGASLVLSEGLPD